MAAILERKARSLTVAARSRGKLCQCRSVGFGLACVLPSGLAVAMSFAVMGLMGIPLGVATSMFAAMTVGIGVDYAIHLQTHYRRYRSAGHSTYAALPEAATAVGPAIGVDTLAVALGFGALTLSGVPANARLGGLLALSVLNCFLCTMLLLPALIGIRGRTSQTRC